MRARRKLRLRAPYVGNDASTSDRRPLSSTHDQVRFRSDRRAGPRPAPRDASDHGHRTSDRGVCSAIAATHPGNGLPCHHDPIKANPGLAYSLPGAGSASAALRTA